MHQNIYITPAKDADLAYLAAIESSADTLFPPGRLPVDGGTYALEDFQQALMTGCLFVAGVPQAAKHPNTPSEPAADYASVTRQGDPSSVQVVTIENRNHVPGDIERVGFAVGQQRENHLHLALLAVTPNWGGRGIGRALVAQVLADARAKSKQCVTLTTFSDLPWNAPFYQSMGFEVIEVAEMTSFLQQILDTERGLGMHHRVAMRHCLD